MSANAERSLVEIDKNELRSHLASDPRVVLGMSSYIGAYKSLCPDSASGEYVEPQSEYSLAYDAARVSARWAIALTTIVEDPISGWDRSVLRPTIVQAYLNKFDEAQA